MRVAVLLSLILVLAPAFAQEEVPVARPVVNGLSLNSYSVSIEADDSIATTVVEETFYNSGGGMREADFYFPLPPGTAATGLQLSMGGKYYGGNLLTRKRARRIYDEITRRRQDPALLDCVGKDIYRCRVFPVPGKGVASIKFSYRQPLAADGSMRRLVVPLDAARFNRGLVEEFSLNVHLKTESALQSIFCPTHDVSVERIDVHEANITLRAKRAHLARDLVLMYAVEDAPLGAVVSSYRRGGQRGYFVMSIDAAFAREKQRVAPRDIVVAVDTSNSTRRNGVDAAAVAVADALAGLRPKDRYALVAFSTEARLLSDFRHPDENTAKEVRTLLASQPVAGRTRLAAALRGAAEVARRGHPGTGIILLTDGRETIDRTRVEAVATQTAKNGNRIGICGLGDSVDTAMLDLIGDLGRGDSTYGRRKLSNGVRYLFDTTRSAPLANVEVDIAGVNELYPSELRVVKADETILVAGRYSRAGPRTVTIRGEVGGEPVTHSFKVDLREQGGDPAVARMWAARRVGYLLDEARRRGDAAYRRDEIRRLGRQFGIVTPHTSLLVLEQADQKRFLSGMRRRPLLNSDGGELKRRVYTRAINANQLAERIKALRNAKSGATNPFADLLGKNRLRMRRVQDRTFYKGTDGTWVESELVDKEPAEPREVVFLSEEWRALAEDPEVAAVLALGRTILFKLADGTPVRVMEASNDGG